MTILGYKPTSINQTRCLPCQPNLQPFLLIRQERHRITIPRRERAFRQSIHPLKRSDGEYRARTVFVSDRSCLLVRPARSPISAAGTRKNGFLPEGVTMFACLGVPCSRMFISIRVGIDVDRREDGSEPSLDPYIQVVIAVIARSPVQPGSTNPSS